ncbi:MAG: hypothetical protein IPL61_10080 [Myxococcales bacterium]|nr:hypothetical protein [Myxococcales bacterium]
MWSFLARLPAPVRTRRAAVWTAAAILVALALTRTPLFGVLGFEFALVMAGFGSLCGLDLGAAWIRRRRAQGPAPLARTVLEAVAVPTAIVLVPLLMVVVRGLWTRTCDPGFGVRAFGALALASTVLAAGSGAAIALIVGPRRWLGALAPYLVLLALIALGVQRFRSAPPVWSYSPLVGFFPGNLYDEDIQLRAALGWARLEQLATVLAALAAVAARYDRATVALRWRGRGLAWRPATGAVVAALVALGLRASAGSLGYAIDAGDIAAELGGEYRTAHFVIRYDDTPAIRADLALIAADHEFRLAQVCAAIGVTPAEVGTIHAFYFATAERKAALMGARHVEMAKPWLRQIYVTHEDFPHPSLRHEIAHVVAGRFGDPWFHVAARRVLGLPVLVNPGLIEGLAVALDWPGSSRSMTPHQAMRAMEQLGFAPDPSEVFSVRFLTLSSARGYTAAGSFMRFLLDTYGAAPVRAVYASGGDFAGAFGKPRAALVAEWRAMLATITVPAADLEAARERFRQGGVFERPCPHARARREAEAGRRLQRGDRRGAIALLRGLCRDAPDEPGANLTLAAVLVAGDERDQAEGQAAYVRWASPERGAPIRAIALEALARLAGRAGDRVGAQARVDEALALPLDDERRRTFEAMDQALRSPSVAGPFLRGYFFGSGDDDLAWAAMAVALDPTDAFARYLLALQLIERRFPVIATVVLDGALAAGLPSPRFVRAAGRRLAIAAWRADDRPALERAAARLAATGVEVDAALAADWRARAAAAR